ncbi:hypothetical protein [Streptomyces sp. NPDC016845]|uniref:hypothetical protein n=1 Tax=Streptomyces sp. NPDC016845 TaxID=3364972 RepID=UPI00379C68D0
MIVHDVATALPAAIGHAILTVAMTTGLGAAVLVLAVVLLTTAATGAWPTRRRRPAEEPATAYDEAA